MEDVLPENLILEVLSRLPIKKIICCKCVCKKWRDVVSDSYFVKLHLSRSPEAALLIDKYLPWPGNLEWVEIMDGLNPVKSNIHKFRAREYLGTLQVGSVNGLVCCSLLYHYFHIFNPVLEEYMNLNEPQLEINLLVISCGFGVSISGEYKVIRICGRRICFEPEVFAVEIQVYTLGTGQWRVLGQFPYMFSFWEKVEPGVLVNSHVYWDFHNGQFYDFDLNTETFELLASPPEPGETSKHMLGVLKGRLSRVSWCWLGLEVWVMKEGSWCKELAIQENINPILQSQPLCLTDGLKGTSILMVCDQSAKELVAYCLNTNTVLPVNLSSKEVDAYHVKIIRYRPSFVKLHEFVQHGMELLAVD